MPKKSKLTEKQKRFCDFYIETGNAAEAARLAGYSERTARQQGQRLLTDMSTLFWTHFYRTIYINFHEFVCYFKIIYLFQSRANKLAITRP